ncbi:hypothetical protein CDAR_416341 [Caerostris darwini]|uniref:Uncharacterized protein n=1 Tax=Caerostris darwini TaxID=1538125 RepID=A0AAV4SWG6_9ARAC|nr:hypothetical protein CDAR_416341 [Caerostris darwini]
MLWLAISMLRGYPNFHWLSFVTRRSHRSEVVSRRTQYYERIWHSSNASATSVVDRGCLDGTANLKQGIRNVQEGIDDIMITEKKEHKY